MENKIEIIPAVLPSSFEDLEEHAITARGQAATLQVDICDGVFVPNKTWPFQSDPHDDFKKIIDEEVGMPFWEDLNYEFDLMVNNPENHVENWLAAGATRVIIHLEAKGDITKAILMLKGLTEVGLAINIDTDIATIEPYKENINFIQCMGIDRIGYQHQQFDPKVLTKITNIKNQYPGLIVSVDGGVSEKNIKELILAGADRLVIGSAIFGSENPVDAISLFKRQVK